MESTGFGQVHDDDLQFYPGNHLVLLTILFRQFASDRVSGNDLLFNRIFNTPLIHYYVIPCSMVGGVSLGETTLGKRFTITLSCTRIVSEPSSGFRP